MTDEQICELAKDKALDIQKYIIDGNVDIDSFAKNCCLAGAHSRDEEVTSLLSQLEDKDGYIAHLREELNKLRNPWISVEERLPEEPLTICAVWLKDDDLVPHISLYDSGRFLLLPVDVTVTHWMPIPELKKGE